MTKTASSVPEALRAALRTAVRAALPLAAVALLGAAPPAPNPAPAQPTAKPALSPGEIVAAAPAADWEEIAAADLLVMELAPDRTGQPRRVVIQLMPPPFSQGWVGNIRKLAAAHWWDGTSINRVQDNYVAQWGDANGDDMAKAKLLPGGLVSVPQSEYVLTSQPLVARIAEGEAMQSAFFRRGLRDAYAEDHVFWRGWPYATTTGKERWWPIHCYGMVGVGRDMPPDTGTGAELYAVIGTPPRHLDRNIALVGRVIAGIEHLSSLPRGTGALGFYEHPEQRVPIVSVRLGSELAPAQQPHYQYLSTESASFAAYADARANRRDAFFIRPAGGVDICNLPVPVRVRP